MKSIFQILAIFALIGCTTTGSYISSNDSFSPRPENCELEVIMPGQSFNKEHTLVGTFSAQETGFSVNCGWEETLGKNKKKACSVGADVIQFVEVNTPSISSTCYTSKANFLKLQSK